MANRGQLAGFLSIDPERLHESLLTLVLRVSVVLGVIVYIPSVYVSLRVGTYGIALIDTIALLGAFALLHFDRVPFRLRATTICVIYYALGIGLLVSVGSISQIYLFGFSVVTVLLLGLRMGVCAALLSSVSLLGVGASGFAAAGMGIPQWSHNFTEWVVITINFTLVNTLLTLAVGAVLGTINKALKVEIASRLERKLGEAERQRLLAQLQLQIERMPLAYLLCDKDFRYTRWNPAAERMFGFKESDVLGKHPFDLIVPAKSQTLVRSIFDAMKAGSMTAHGESENCTQSGGIITCDWHNTPIFDDAGVMVGLFSLAEDVTVHRKVEEQLRQAQKMEAIGLLAGGVAHDFNNLLSVVLSYSDFLLEDLKADDPKRGDVVEIRRAGERASDLTRQLLMFSRQQLVELKVLDLNEVLTSVDKLLRRLVGEDIEVTSVLAPSLGRIRADPGSIEQVIVNLAVNARDAMPVGGKLTMQTANTELDEEYANSHIGVKPGPYVVLSISDSGSGMDKATLARIFEPFFTTKEKGKGTGLGLSTVFGIASQSGGSVWVYSELGIGTTFKVYLPRVDAPSDTLRGPTEATTLTGSETILLVEDEDQVRSVASGILRRHGYTVLSAQNAGEAVLMSEQHAGIIHLLLSDVVMPQMSGPALAKRLALERPEMKILCMSGYTDDAAVRHGVIDAEFAYLQKPLSVDSLTRKVRDVLDTSV